MSKSKSTSAENVKPTREPANSEFSNDQFSNTGQDRPQDLLPSEILAAQQNVMDYLAAPTLQPPVGVSAQSAVTAVVNNKRITALWGKNQDRNSWVHVDSIGWKKLVNSSSSAITALTMIAAHARELNRQVDYRDEADGMIYEMYVW